MKSTRILTVIAAACCVISAAFGISIAGAASNEITFDGGCSLHGVAKFDAPYLKGEPADVGYHFKTSAPTPSAGGNPNTCTGSLNGGDDKTYPASAYVDGKGQLSCAASTADGGQGAVTVVDGGKAYTFSATLDIKGGGTEVALDLHDAKGGQAYGHASFAKYTTTQTPQDCNGGGVKELQFDADFQGTSPFKSDAPTAAPASNPQPSDSPPPANSDQPASSTTESGTFDAQPQDQGAVQGYQKASPKKAKKKPKCGKSKKSKSKKHTKSKKKCGKAKGHAKRKARRG